MGVSVSDDHKICMSAINGQITLQKNLVQARVHEHPGLDVRRAVHGKGNLRKSRTSFQGELEMSHPSCQCQNAANFNIVWTLHDLSHASACGRDVALAEFF